jgi:hypothetical protein
MDEDLLREMRHRAVDAGMSLSGWVVAILQHQVTEDNERAAAKRRALRRLKTGFRMGGQPLSRDEAHDR